MAFWVLGTIGLLIAYLLGATPSGYLAGKLRGIDIREHGSGSTGATNVLRTLGKWPALIVLLVDALKGWYYRWLASIAGPPAGVELAALVPWAVALSGLAVLLGHGRSIWLGFTGGKSAATGVGVLLAVSWPIGLAAAAVWGVALAVSRIVSLSSILAAMTAMVLVLAFEQPLAYRLLVLAGGLYVILRHRANIGRLWAGTEPRLGQSVPASPSAH